MRSGRASVICVALAASYLGSARAAEIAPGIALSGDLRVRSESLFRNAAFSADGDVHRARLRLRVALGVDVNENWDLDFRLATGGGTTSTNQDLGPLVLGGAELFVDRAYARFHTGDDRAFDLYAGRMPNPYSHSMILWDSDFNPDGLAQKLVRKGESADVFLNAGQHVLGPEGALDRNYGPVFFAIQPGIRLKRGEGSLEVAAAYYRFLEADGVAVFGDVPDGSDYAIADVYARCRRKTAGGRPWGVWADVLVNTEADDARTAWGIGFDCGTAREKGSAKVSLKYMVIDKNALWISLGDANFSSGLTDEDMHGVVLGATVGIGEGATLGASWCFKDSRDTDARENQIEIDLMLKF